MNSHPSTPPTDAADGPLVLIGGGGHARVVAAGLGEGRLAGVLDTDPARIGEMLGGVAIQADTGIARTESLHLAIGDNATRARLAGARPGAEFAAIVHRHARVAPDAIIAPGAFVAMGAIVQAGARIGAHAIVNSGAIVEHDGRIGAFAHIGPGAVLAGEVTVGEGALVGAGAVVLPGLEIGAWAVVGAGAVVTGAVEAGQTVVGCPARVLS